MTENNPYVFCTHCGKKLPPSAKFCSYCGKSQETGASAGGGQPPIAPTPPVAPPPAVPPAPSPILQQGAVQPIAPPAKPANRKKQTVLICVAAVLVAVAVLAAHFHQREQDYQEQLNTGLHFLGEQNYEEAILAFTAAIDIKPKGVEAYIGRGDAYAALDDHQTAAIDYEKATELDKKNPEGYLGLAGAYLELGRREDAIAILEQGAQETGDERITEWLELLLQKDGASALSGMVSEYRPEGGTAPLPGARIRLYCAIGETPRLICTASSGPEGGFSIDGLQAGTYTLQVDAENHIGIETEEVLSEDEVGYTELFLMIPATEEVRSGLTDQLYAQVTNAINGEPVPGALVSLRSGWNNREGDWVAQTTTADWGDFYVDDLPYGYYTAETSADGYISAFHNVAVLPQEFISEWNLPMSPVLGDQETRIVLTWNEEPYDLDSHLMGEEFHVFFGERDAYDASYQHRVNLDLDDTTSYGPETITIYQGVDGVYTYFVHDYTNRYSGSSSALSMSGATVRVYQRDGLTAIYHIPTGIVGTTWTVFRIHSDGTLEPVNAIDNTYLW